VIQIQNTLGKARNVTNKTGISFLANQLGRRRFLSWSLGLRWSAAGRGVRYAQVPATNTQYVVFEPSQFHRDGPPDPAAAREHDCDDSSGSTGIRDTTDPMGTLFDNNERDKMMRELFH